MHSAGKVRFHTSGHICRRSLRTRVGRGGREKRATLDPVEKKKKKEKSVECPFSFCSPFR